MALTSPAPLLELLDNVCSEVREVGAVDSDSAAKLAFLCPDEYVAASSILDHQNPIKELVASDSGRSFFLVGSSTKKPHLSIPGFCTCSAFCHKVAARREAIVCKHELAARLAQALSKAEVRRMSEEGWANAFSSAWMLAMFESDGSFKDATSGTPGR